MGNRNMQQNTLDFVQECQTSILTHATPGVSMQISRNYEKTMHLIGNINKSERHTEHNKE